MGKFALLIGVGDYESSEFQNLAAAIPDVRAIEKVLIDPAIADFAQTDMMVLLNPEPQQMREAIERLFTDRKKDDLVLLYFSGHGVVDDFGRFHLTTARTDKRFLNSTAIPATFVHGLMEWSKSQRQVVILDSCFSGAFAKEMKAKGEAVNLQPQLGGKGRVVLTSSSATEYSFEQKEGKLSVYTQYLEEGLRTGIADRDEDGWISIDELHEFAREKVQEVTPAMQPKIYVAEQGYKIVFAKAPVGDPKLAYRKEVEHLAKERNGELSEIVLIGLETKQKQLGLSNAVAEGIRQEVLRPYQEFAEKVQKFQKALQKVRGTGSPITQQSWNDLLYLQQMLGLTAQNVEHTLKGLKVLPTPPERHSKRTSSKTKSLSFSQGSGILIGLAGILGVAGIVLGLSQIKTGQPVQSPQSAPLNSPAATSSQTPSIQSVKTAQDWYKQAFKKENGKDYQGAIEDYTKAIELKPDFAEAYINRGISRRNLSDYKGAIEDYTKAIELRPDFAEAYKNRGYSRLKLSDYKGAIEDYTKAIEFKPDYALAYNNRGASRSNLSDNKGAIEDYTEAIRLDKNWGDFNQSYFGLPTAYNNRGLARFNLSDNRGAIEDYNKAIELKPDYAEAYYNRGFSRLKLSDNKGAIEDYNKAIELKPDYAEAYYIRGNSRSNSNDNKGAIEDYTKAIELKTDDAKAYYNRGNSRRNLSDYKGAIEDYTKAIELKTDFVDAYYSRAASHEDLGDKNTAIADYRKAVDLYPTDNPWRKKALDKIKELQ